jgi:hypothetical protein
VAAPLALLVLLFALVLQLLLQVAQALPGILTLLRWPRGALLLQLLLLLLLLLAGAQYRLR